MLSLLIEMIAKTMKMRPNWNNPLICAVVFGNSGEGMEPNQGRCFLHSKKRFQTKSPKCEIKF